MPSTASARPSATRRVVITHALRTPIGRYLGAFADLSAADLGASVVKSLLARSGIDAAAVTELVFGNARQAGGGPNVARQVAVRAGIPVERTAWTVNMACGSGLKALNLAVDSIRLGRAEIAVAGGTESMSGLPFFLPNFRRGYRLGHAPVVDAMYKDGFACPLADMLMGETAEKLARELGIPRSAQDEFALTSQRRCEAARKAGRFADEIAPVVIAGRKGESTTIALDEHPRDGATLESLAKLPPVFDAQTGTVSAGNSSGITDGAAALLVMSEQAARERGLTPLAAVGESTEAGVDPTVMGIGPVPALRALERRAGRATGSYDLIELNEAFAAQVLACHRELPLPLERLNVNGGSIALGHPIGCTGARIVVTLLHELRRRDAHHGLATLCISGGMGLATAFER
ncbi:MAG: acetyl-CoA C-acetyltransferase [Planctomycetes bacterium]|nr:acetyl-CoA C-acetyltransferase [Planctomycetota bacterium]